MPACSKAIHPSGIEIEFFEDTHKYVSTINGKEITYISGTGFLHQFFPEFDPTGVITERCAKKEGLTVEQIKEKWAAKGRESCRLGTRLHEVCEDIELGRDLRNTPEDDVEKARFANGIKMAKAFRVKLDILGVEKIVFDPELKIAGTIDLFAQSRKDKSYVIIDHKTNAEIERANDNPYNKFCLAPVEHLPDTSFYHYALQLNLYAYLLKRNKYVPKDSKFKFYLDHVTADKADLIELPALESDIKEMIISHLMKQIT